MTTERLAPAITERDHATGPADAPVTLIEYGDFQCPYCGAAYPVLKRVKARLGDRLRFVFRPFPLTESHPNAEHAAEAAESVAAQGGPEAFWAMHDLLFEHQRRLDDASLLRYAKTAGADPARVAADLADGRYTAMVQESFTGGVRAGVNGTPTLFIDGIRYDGPRDEESLITALEVAVESR